MNIPSGVRHELCRGVHAEQNAIIQAAYFGGISVENATLYVTTYPCSMCAKILINAGIKEIIYDQDYVDDFSVKLFNEVGMSIKRYHIKA